MEEVSIVSILSNSLKEQEIHSKTLSFEEKMEKLTRYYSGLIGLKKAPDALLIIDARSEHIASTEARKSGIPVIALVNSDSNIKSLDYPIVANDAGIPSIKFFITAIGDAYKQGQTSLPEKKP